MADFAIAARKYADLAARFGVRYPIDQNPILIEETEAALQQSRVAFDAVKQHIALEKHAPAPPSCSSTIASASQRRLQAVASSKA